MNLLYKFLFTAETEMVDRCEHEQSYPHPEEF